jgi:hypothetical protein
MDSVEQYQAVQRQLRDARDTIGLLAAQNRVARQTIDHLTAENRRLRGQLKCKRSLNEAAHKLGGSR